MHRQPIPVYRLRCGRKKHSGWKTSKRDVWLIAIEKGLAYRGLHGGSPGLGPLTWIERGTRKYARSKTVPVSRDG